LKTSEPARSFATFPPKESQKGLRSYSVHDVVDKSTGGLPKGKHARAVPPVLVTKRPGNNKLAKIPPKMSSSPMTTVDMSQVERQGLLQDKLLQQCLDDEDEKEMESRIFVRVRNPILAGPTSKTAGRIRSNGRPLPVKHKDGGYVSEAHAKNDGTDDAQSSGMAMCSRAPCPRNDLQKNGSHFVDSDEGDYITEDL
jgi:hypothetical protein